MSFRSRIIILSALTLVLTVGLAIGVLRSPRRGAPAGADIALIGAEIADQVSRISVEGQDALRLQRDQGGRWWIDAGDRVLPARAARIDEFLTLLAGSSTTRRVTGNPDLWSDFGVDDRNARRVLLEGDDGEVLADLRYGRRAEAGSEVFVRLGAADDVFAAESAAVFYLERASLYWTELRLFASAVSPEAIERLSVRSRPADIGGLSRRFSYELRRSSEGSWLLIDDRGEAPARQSRVREILAAVAALEGSRVAPEAPAADAAAVLDFQLRDGSRYEVRILGTADDERFTMFARGPRVPLDTAGQPLYYFVNDWTLERILRLPQDLSE